MRSIVYNSSLKTELGTILITANEEELLGIHFVSLAPSENENKLTKTVKKELIEYFAKTRTVFSKYPLKLSTIERQILRLLEKYLMVRQLAIIKWQKELGNVNAVKSVAKVLQDNPYLILLPCHRVLGKNKTLYNYQAGIKVKRTVIKIRTNVIVEIKKNYAKLKS